MLLYLQQNPTIHYFYAYGSTLTSFGLIIGSLYNQIAKIKIKNSLQGNQQEENLSNLYYFRILGFLVGGILMNQFANKFKLHHIIMFGSLTAFASLSIFCLCVESVSLMRLFMTLASCSMAMVIIPTNMNLINIHVTNNQQFWILLGHSMFAFGSLISPIFADIFGIYTLMFGGFLLGLASISYWFIEAPSPPPYATRIQYLIKELNNPELLENKKKIETTYFPKYIQLQFFLVIFLTNAVQSSFTKNSNNFLSQSRDYSNILLAITILSRMITFFLPGTPSQKIQTLIKIQAIILIFCLLISLLGQQVIAIDLAVIGLGGATAGHFLLHLVLSFQFGISGCDERESGFVLISATIGQLIGKQISNPFVQYEKNFLFIFPLAILLALNFFFRQLKSDFKNEFKNRFNEEALKSKIG